MTVDPAPASYLVLDLGMNTGFAFCERGGRELHSGVWRFKGKSHGEIYHGFLKMFANTLDALPQPVAVGIEDLTIVARQDAKGKPTVDAHQIEVTAGWYSIAKLVCYLRDIAPPEMLNIAAWRSRTHGKTRAPDKFRGTDWLKQQAVNYCKDQGWYPKTHDEAEALCMLVYLRILHEPDFAFDKGLSFQQEPLL